MNIYFWKFTLWWCDVEVALRGQDSATVELEELSTTTLPTDLMPKVFWWIINTRIYMKPSFTYHHNNLILLLKGWMCQCRRWTKSMHTPLVAHSVYQLHNRSSWPSSFGHQQWRDRSWSCCHNFLVRAACWGWIKVNLCRLYRKIIRTLCEGSFIYTYCSPEES